MKFRINFTLSCGTEDSFIVTGETIKECQEKTSKFFKDRGLIEKDCNPWSEKV